MDRPLRIALAGAGRIAASHLKAIAENPDQLMLAGICDMDVDAAAGAAASAGGVPFFADLGPLLADVECDAVVVCSSSDAHAAHVLAATAASRHVLVEKPMATSLSQCRAMVQAADDAGVILMVGQNHRFMPNYRAVRNALAAGELGTVRAIRLDAMGNCNAPPGHWARDGRRAGGGVVISLAIHRIDLARYFLGDIRRVTARCQTTDPRFIHGAEDYAWANLQFESGAVGDLFACWSAPALPWGESFTILGDQGTIHAIPAMVSYHSPCLVRSQRRTGLQPPPKGTVNRGFVPMELATDELPASTSIANELLHFAQCCREGRQPLSSGRDNLGTMRAVFGIYESARREVPVELAEL